MKPNLEQPAPVSEASDTRTASDKGDSRAAHGSETVAVSENFERAFASGSGGCVRDCDCGRTNYDYHNHWDWEDGELEELMEKAKTQPGKYVGHDHSVDSMYVAGKEIVMGCPCNSARPYENWIIAHAEQIADYLNRRADDLQKESERTRVKSPIDELSDSAGETV